MEQLQQISKIAFASEFSFALKAQNFHWNVEGMFFQQFHELFGSIYEDTYGSIDDFAENLRKLGTYAPGSLSRFNMLTKVEDETDEGVPAEAMLKELLMDSEKMIVILKKAYAASEAAGESGFSNFLAERIDGHRKHGWMLRASLKG